MATTQSTIGHAPTTPNNTGIRHGFRIATTVLAYLGLLVGTFAVAGLIAVYAVEPLTTGALETLLMIVIVVGATTVAPTVAARLIGLLEA